MRHRTGISCFLNPAAREKGGLRPGTQTFSLEAARSVLKFHQSMPGYRPTPLISLEGLAKKIRIAHIWIKDESQRLELKAFKVLGASYAMAYALTRKLGLKNQDLTFNLFKSDAGRKALEHLTVATATDGNHGRAVAWTARRIGCRAVVFMPKGSSPARVENIRAHGAQTFVIEGNYDDAVHLAAARAEKEGWILVQDSSWKGYEDIPLRIMQGYMTLMTEILGRLEGKRPTHVFVQCGVGSFAASVQAHLCELYGRERPRLAVVEPLTAACYFTSMSSGGDRPRKVDGDLKTIMASLACGEPSLLAWRILRKYADAFVACPDDIAVKGMRALACPSGSDRPLISGESGAVTAGLLISLMEDPLFAKIRRDLKLDGKSRVLLFSTEGDTDPAMYRNLVHGTGS